MKRIVFGIAMPLAVSVALLAQGRGDAAKGKQLFIDYTCYGCHGYSGQNGPGAKLVPMKMSAIAFTAYVRSPRTKQMPSYSAKVRSDAQLADIHAYVLTLKDAPAFDEIKALKELKAEVSK